MLGADVGPPGLQGKDGPQAPGSSTVPRQGHPADAAATYAQPQHAGENSGGSPPACHCSLHQVPDTDRCPWPHALPHLHVAACAEESGWGRWRP